MIKTIDFSTSMWSCRPRILWQQLFNFYQEKGCPLDHLDNLLVDYNNCLDVFKQFEKTELEAVDFIWCCYPGHFMTKWICNSKDQNETIFDLYEQVSSYESDWFYVICQLSPIKSIFHVQ